MDHKIKNCNFCHWKGASPVIDWTGDKYCPLCGDRIYEQIEGIIESIGYKKAKAFLLPRHYSGRTPSISYAFGWMFNNKIKAVLTIGKPASNTLCDGICGKEFSKRVYELNRLCREDDLEAPLSKFVSNCLRMVSQDNLIIVAYSDTAMMHNGYIYQACNFIYTGATKKRTEQYTDSNKHSRHSKSEDQLGYRKIRTSKHRYVYFAMSDKKLKKIARNSLNYPVRNYPKGENGTYKLGEYLKPTIYKVDNPPKE